MTIRKFALSSVFVLSVSAVPLGAQAARTGSPHDGAPFPANNYAHFEYIAGVVRHTFTGGTENWDLTAHTEESGSKTTVLRAKGNATTGVECWNYFTNNSGVGSLAATRTTPSGCSGVADEITLPSVSFSEGSGFLGVTCKLPAAQSGCDPRIAYYRYTSTPHGDTRTGAPIDGAPFPAASYSEFFATDSGGVGRLSSSAGLKNWDLTPHIDSGGAHHARVAAKGNSTEGTFCFGVAVTNTGADTAGSTNGTQPGCSGADTLLSTPVVNVASTGTFLVTCKLPPNQGCTPHLSYYRFDVN